MEVRVLGAGCAKCRKLFEEAQKAAAQFQQPITLIKVEKIDEIMSYGVMVTPALVVGSEVKSSGRIPAASEIAAWITDGLAKG